MTARFQPLGELTNVLSRRRARGSSRPLTRSPKWGSRIHAIKIRILKAATVFMVATSDSKAERIVPLDWMPSLDTIEEAFPLDGKRPQQELNRNSQQLAEIKDAQLFILYVRLANELRPSSRDAFRKEQEKWLRDRQNAVEAAVESPAGSLAALERSSTFRKLTEQRIQRLAERLAATRQKNPPQKKKQP